MRRLIDPCPRPIPYARLARLLGVAPAWLAAELDAGRLPGLRAGDRWLCDQAAVEAALLARARKFPGGTEHDGEKGGAR